MTTRRKLVSIISILALLALPAVSSAASGMEVTFSFPEGTTVKQGAFLEFKATVKNTGQETRNANITLTLFGGPDQVEFQRINQTLGPGNFATHELRISPGQWFTELGDVKIEAREGQDVVGLAVLNVVPSPRRVPRFVDVAESAGTQTVLPVFECGTWSAGAAWGDIDGDKDLDLYLPRDDRPPHLWVNDSGQFTDEAPLRGVGEVASGLGAVFADYDNDGDQDLYVAVDGPNRLYRNDGTGNFSEVGQVAGVDDGGPSQSASWGDFDRDGRLDLYVSNHARCSSGGRVYTNDRLYRNRGDGTFEDVTSALPVPSNWAHDGAGFQALFSDFDRDGDPDILLANDYLGADPKPNVLWRNDTPPGGHPQFVDRSIASGFNLSMNSMGLGPNDFDRDGDIDYAVSNIRAPAFFENQGDGSFRNSASRLNVDRVLNDASSIAITWGVLSADFNNDGREDLYFPAGRLGSETSQPNQLYTNWSPKKGFLDHSAPSRTNDMSISRGVALADYDRDGRVDMYVVNQDGQPRLYKNVTPKKRHHWLEVDTVGRVSNRDGCGSWLKLKIKGATMVREVYCGGISLGSGNDHTVHFGLGKKMWVKKLVVTFPSGRKKVKRGFKADRLLIITEPRSSG